MLVKTVNTVVSTDSVGRPVDALPVREWQAGDTDASGRPVAPVAVEESASGVPVRYVAGKAAQNSAGQLVDVIPVTGGGVPSVITTSTIMRDVLVMRDTQRMTDHG